MDRPSWVTNEPSWQKNCRRTVARAQDLLNGRASVITTARELRKLQFWVRAKNDPDFIVFEGISSETDHLPVGKERQHWDADALRRKDEEIRLAEDSYKNQAFDAAQNLIEKYKAR
jgi:hypothetical protein